MVLSSAVHLAGAAVAEWEATAALAVAARVAAVVDSVSVRTVEPTAELVSPVHLRVADLADQPAVKQGAPLEAGERRLLSQAPRVLARGAVSAGKLVLMRLPVASVGSEGVEEGSATEVAETAGLAEAVARAGLVEDRLVALERPRDLLAARASPVLAAAEGLDWAARSSSARVRLSRS